MSEFFNVCINLWLIGIPFFALLSIALTHTHFARQFPSIFSFKSDGLFALCYGFFIGVAWPLGFPMLYFLTKHFKYGLSFRLDPRVRK